MSDTPITDANTYGGKGVIGAGYVSADASRRLERDKDTRIADLERELAEHRRHVRRLDVIWNGEEGAAKQASLIDVIAQIETEICAFRKRVEELERENARLRKALELAVAWLPRNFMTRKDIRQIEEALAEKGASNV